MARKRPPYNPLAPIRPRSLRRIATQDVNAQILPLLAQITSQFDRQSRAGGNTILAGTEELARQLAPLQQQTHDIYAQAQGSQAAVTNAVANRLQGAGSQLGGEIGAKLAAAGLGGQVANTAAASGAAQGGVQAALGGADLSRLLSQGASAENFSAMQPGIARLGGAQHAREFAAQLASERASALGDVRAKIPGTLAQVLSDLRNLEFQKAAANLGFQGDVYSQQQQTQRTNIQQSNANARNRRTTQAANQRTGMNVAERARHNQISEAQQRKKDRINAKQAARAQWYKEHSGNKKKKGKGGGPPSMNR